MTKEKNKSNEGLHEDADGPGRIRSSDQEMMSPLVTFENPEENVNSHASATVTTASAIGREG